MENSILYDEVIDSDFKILLNDYSKKLNISEAGLIEKAVRRYIHELKRKEYQESFAKAKQDIEIEELSEAGIEDFLEMIGK